jgi:hypothetical protein
VGKPSCSFCDDFNCVVGFFLPGKVFESVTVGDHPELEKKLWGTTQPATETGAELPGICGVFKEWDRYLAYILTVYDPSKETGYWDVGSTYIHFNAVTNYNTLISSNHCRFNIIVTPQFAPYIPGLPSAKNDYANVYMQKNTVLIFIVPGGMCQLNMSGNNCQQPTL